jgi:hypothetical protein
MRPDYTIQSDWSKWEDHAKTCDIRALRHIISDCRNAAAAMRSHNTDKEGFYIDQACTYSDELRNRLT